MEVKKKKKYTKKENGKNDTGRPSKLTEELIIKLEQLLEKPTAVILTDEDICIYLDIDEDTKKRWLDDQTTELHRKFYGLIKKLRVNQKLDLSERVAIGDNGWQGSAWILERKFEDLRLVQVQKVDQNSKVKLEGSLTLREETKKRLDNLLE